MSSVRNTFLIEGHSLGLKVSLGLSGWRKDYTRVAVRAAVSEGNCVCLKSILQRALLTIHHFQETPGGLNCQLQMCPGGICFLLTIIGTDGCI